MKYVYLNIYDNQNKKYTNISNNRGISIINNYMNQLGGKPKKVIPKQCRFECGFFSALDHKLNMHELICEFNPTNVKKKRGRSFYLWI